MAALKVIWRTLPGLTAIPHLTNPCHMRIDSRMCGCSSRAPPRRGPGIRPQPHSHDKLGNFTNESIDAPARAIGSALTLLNDFIRFGGGLRRRAIITSAVTALVTLFAAVAALLVASTPAYAAGTTQQVDRRSTATGTTPRPARATAYRRSTRRRAAPAPTPTRSPSPPTRPELAPGHDHLGPPGRASTS